MADKLYLVLMGSNDYENLCNYLTEVDWSSDLKNPELKSIGEILAEFLLKN